MAKSKTPLKKIKEKNPQSKNTTNNTNSWAVVRTLFTCKHLQTQMQQQIQQKDQNLKKKEEEKEEKTKKKNIKKCKKKKMNYCSAAGSLCNNTKVMQRPNNNNNNNNIDSSAGKSMKISLKELNGGVSGNDLSKNSSSSSMMSAVSTSSPSFTGTFKAMPFRKLSGCYECKMVVDPVLGFGKDPFLRATICSCPICGEMFMKAEYLELHLTTRHAVSELEADDTSKNIVEIIFQSSWLKKQNPICIIDRILKVQNTPKTISRFEEYRDTIKSKATKLQKKHPRCIADGNELLRFHSTTFTCSLGLNGSTNLCNSIPRCHVCSIIKSGFKVTGEAENPGVLTTATSGKAHDKAKVSIKDDKRAMLVCRVIAGRVKKTSQEANIGDEDYDSIAGNCEVYSNLDELYVFNPKAILPCFVVIYRAI